MKISCQSGSREKKEGGNSIHFVFNVQRNLQQFNCLILCQIFNICGIFEE